MDVNKALNILAACKPLAHNLLEPGALYTYRLNDEEHEILSNFARVYNTLAAPQLKLYAGEALLTQIELLYLLDLLALVRLRGEIET